jgi:glucose/arabinose dehydrogenase
MSRLGWVTGALATVLLASFAACGDETTSAQTSSTNPGGTPSSGGSGGSGAEGGTPATGGGGVGGGTGGGVQTGANCDAPTGVAGGLMLTPVHQGLGFPMMVTFVPGDDSQLFIVERNGTIVRSENGGAPELFLDVGAGNLNNDFTSSGEGGLLGLAFHPDYTNNGRFFVHYTASGPYRNVIQEFRRAPNDPTVADANPVHPPHLLVTQQASNHNGGHIEFSALDDMLYIAIGDGGPQGDPEDDAVDVTASHLGKILRIDVSATDGSYANPPGNAPGAGALPEIFDWGLRNPYRFSFDLCTGDRYIGDVGQNAWEEVDVGLAGSGPTNWGWNCFEGNNTYPGAPGCPFGGEVGPVHEYQHASGNNSITGGVVYRGHDIPWLRGAYIYGDWNSGRVWMFRFDGTTATMNQEITQLPAQGIPGFGNDNQGNVYVCHSNGTVYRVEAQ